jgi:hypothetical protein
MTRPLKGMHTVRLNQLRPFGVLSLLSLSCCVALADDFSPFPPGENAALVKKTCTECHAADVVLSTQFDEALARKQYKLFVGDPDSEDGQKVIKYLTTVLGPR